MCLKSNCQNKRVIAIVKFHCVCHDKGCVKGSWRVTPNTDLHLLTLLSEHVCECERQQVATSLLELVVSCLHDIRVPSPHPSDLTPWRWVLQNKEQTHSVVSQSVDAGRSLSPSRRNHSSVFFLLQQKTQPKVEEEEEEEERKQPDPLHQLILHFSHNALTERRWAHARLLRTWPTGSVHSLFTICAALGVLARPPPLLPGKLLPLC